MSVKSKKTVGNRDFKDALVKKALGYDVKEIIEEYAGGQDGEVKLVKKKVTIKNVPPDVAALKILLDETNDSLETLSDEQLVEEKARLLNLLNEYDQKEQKNCKKKVKEKKKSI